MWASATAYTIGHRLIHCNKDVNCFFFSQTSYDGSLTGTTILEEFTVEDADLVGDIIEVTCADVSLVLVRNFQFTNSYFAQNAEICDHVAIDPSLSSASLFRGSVVVRKPLDPAVLGNKPSFTLIATVIIISKLRIEYGNQ